MIRTLAATVLAVLAAVGPPGPSAGPAGSTAVGRAAPAAAVDGVQIDGSSRYELVDGDRVHVSVEVQLTNLVAPRVVGRFVESSVLDVFAVPVLADAEAVSVTQQGEARPVDLATDAPLVSFVVVDLEPDLEHGSPQTVSVEYDLPAQPPRSESFVRINPAFVSFPLFAIGDPGRADVVVRLPDDLEVTFVGAQPVSSDDGEDRVFRFDDVAEPESFTTAVAGRDDDALVAAEVEVSGVDVTVRAWPDDPQWAGFVSSSLRDGIPALEDLIGRDWPAGERLDVVESASPYLYGYSGWFRPAEGLIEIGDELDDQVVLHELAHLWFNDGLFEGRWISEGFAEAYASRVRARLGRTVEPPVEPAADDPGRQPLEEWTTPDLTEPVADARERYGYATSHLVIDRLVADAGEAAMRDVLDAAAEREISYVGDGPAEHVRGAPGWRRLLDLVEERTDASGVADLFDRYVTADGTDELDRRLGARDAYAALVDEGSGWSPPHLLRTAMTAWDFERADALLAEARSMLRRKGALLDAVRPVGVERLRGLEETYERARMDVVRAAFDGHERVAALLVRAADRAEGASGPLAWVGRLGDPVGDHLERAVTAFAAGDLGVAERAAHDAIDADEHATTRGAWRLVAGIGVVLTATGAWVLRSSRGRRRPAAQP